MKEDLADIINVGIEELVRQTFELPGFTTIHEEAQRGRAEVNRGFCARVFDSLGEEGRKQIDRLWEEPGAEALTTGWNNLKQDSGSPTLTHLKELVDRHKWLSDQQLPASILGGLPTLKINQFEAEAKSLDAARMLELEPYKRYTLAAVLLQTQLSRVRDDLGQMFIKRMMRIHRRGKEALALHHLKHQERTDGLIRTLRDVVAAHQTDGGADERLAAIGSVLSGKGPEVLEQCEAHEANAGNNHHPFLWRFFASHRPTLFRIWRAIRMKTTSQDSSLEKALAFIMENEQTRADWIPLDQSERAKLDLSWVPENWWRLVTGQTKRDPAPLRVNRRHLEVCVFTQLTWDLKSGDASIAGSTEFADYREQLSCGIRAPIISPSPLFAERAWPRGSLISVNYWARWQGSFPGSVGADLLQAGFRVQRWPAIRGWLAPSGPCNWPSGIRHCKPVPVVRALSVWRGSRGGGGDCFAAADSVAGVDPAGDPRR